MVLVVTSVVAVVVTGCVLSTGPVVTVVAAPIVIATEQRRVCVYVCVYSP